MKQKNEKVGFLSMLLSTLGASLLGNMLAGKGIVRAGFRKRNCENCFWKRNGFLMPTHPLTNFEIKIIIRMNEDLIVFILDIICLKRMGHM